jgi:hypothetical protein
MIKKNKDLFSLRSFRVQVVISINELISLYYLYLFVSSLAEFDELPLINTARHGIAFLGIIFGAYLLNQGKIKGKTITKLVGILGIIYAIGYVFYGFSFIGKPGYSTVIVVNSTMNYIYSILIKHIYPLIAGFIILGKSDSELGLE